MNDSLDVQPIPPRSSSNRLTLVLGITLVLALIAATYWALSHFNRQLPPNVSNNILALTQPVNSVSGQVVSYNKPTLTLNVSGQEYQITVPPECPIIQNPLLVQYLFRKNDTDSPPVPENKDPDVLPPGLTISVTSEQDLRSVTNNQFTAQSIALPLAGKILMGRVKSLANNSLTVTAFDLDLSPHQYPPVNPPQPEEKSFTVALTRTTEISGIIPPSSSNPAPSTKQYSLRDLTPNTYVRIFADLNNDTLTALRIEPLVEPPQSQ